jgi:hypothetical protein
MANERSNKPEEREKLVLTIESGDFKEFAVGHIGFITSQELCGLINSYFRPVFDDYEGSKFKIDPYGVPYMSVFFNHRAYPDDAVRGFTPDIEKDRYNNETLRRIKRQNRLNRFGADQYSITQDAKDVFDDYIYAYRYNRVEGVNLRNSKGKVQWDNVAMGSTSQPMAPNYSFMQPRQEVLSEIIGIDPTIVFEKKFKKKGVNTTYAYEVTLNRSISPDNWLLSVMQYDSTQVENAIKKAGIVNPNGLGIIK